MCGISPSMWGKCYSIGRGLSKRLAILNLKDIEKSGTELSCHYNESKGPEDGRMLGPWKNRNEAGATRDERASETVGQAGAAWAEGSR